MNKRLYQLGMESKLRGSKVFLIKRSKNIVGHIRNIGWAYKNNLICEITFGKKSHSNFVKVNGLDLALAFNWCSTVAIHHKGRIGLTGIIRTKDLCCT